MFVKKGRGKHLYTVLVNVLVLEGATSGQKGCVYTHRLGSYKATYKLATLLAIIVLFDLYKYILIKSLCT